MSTETAVRVTTESRACHGHSDTTIHRTRYSTDAVAVETSVWQWSHQDRETLQVSVHPADTAVVRADLLVLDTGKKVVSHRVGDSHNDVTNFLSLEQARALRDELTKALRKASR